MKKSKVEYNIERDMLLRLQLSNISSNAINSINGVSKQKLNVSRPTQEMIDDFNKQFEQGVERIVADEEGNISKQRFKYNLPELTAEEELIPVPPEVSDQQLRTLEDDKKQLAADYEYQNEVIKNIRDEITQLKDVLNSIGSSNSKGARKKKTITKQRLRLFEDMLNDALIDGGNIESQINSIQPQIDMYAKDLSENKRLISEATQENARRMKEYSRTIKLLNNNDMNLEQFQNESEQDYLNRLQRIGDLPIDETITKNRAIISNITEFKKNMQSIIPTEWRIELILKSFPIEDIAQLNKTFVHFKELILQDYGYNNMNMSNEDYINAIKAFLNKRYIPVQKQIEAAPNGNEFERDVEGFNESKSNEIHDNLPTEQLHTFINNISFNIRNNTLMLLNASVPNEPLYLKISEKRTASSVRLIILYSKTGEKNSFKTLSFKPSNTDKANYFQTIFYDYLGMTQGEVNSRFTLRTSGSKIPYIEDVYKALLDLGLRKLDFNSLKSTKIKNGTHGRETEIFGYGIAHEKIPKYCSFGKLHIMLEKLYYQNILSVSDKNKNNISGFNNSHVSDNLVSIIMNLCQHNKHPTKTDINNLSVKDKELYDMLIYKSGLYKKDLPDTKSETIQKLKNRLELIESEIEAGNNNQELKKELYDVIFKLYNLGSINISTARKHYKKIVDEFF